MFDEGRYGAGKMFFRGRFTSLTEVATQIEILLRMGSPIARTVDLSEVTVITSTLDEDDNTVDVTSPNILGYNRWNCKTNMTAPYASTKDPRDCYPYKASYPINILLRFKFFNGFGYLNIGDRWGSMYEEDGYTVKSPEEQFLPTVGGKEADDPYTAADLKVISTCWLSVKDAEAILDEIIANTAVGATFAALNDSKDDEDVYATTEDGIVSVDDNLLLIS